jgi:hypothetical protein
MPLATALWLLAAAAQSAPPVTPLPVDAHALALGKNHAHIVHAVRWRDRLGDHTVLLAEEGPLPSAVKNEDFGEFGNDASVYAEEYVEAGGKAKRVWALEDHERDCHFDLLAEFVPGSVTVTDLDADGVGEVTFQYSLQCTSDVSPVTRKLILREGADKYAIRGTDRNKFYDPEYSGVRELDPAFAKAPAAFRAHAFAQWEAFVDYGGPMP